MGWNSLVEPGYSHAVLLIFLLRFRDKPTCNDVPWEMNAHIFHRKTELHIRAHKASLGGLFLVGLAWSWLLWFSWGHGSILWWCRRLERVVWGAAFDDDDDDDDDLDDDLPAMIL